MLVEFLWHATLLPHQLFILPIWHWKQQIYFWHSHFSHLIFMLWKPSGAFSHVATQTVALLLLLSAYVDLLSFTDTLPLNRPRISLRVLFLCCGWCNHLIMVPLLQLTALEACVCVLVSLFLSFFLSFFTLTHFCQHCREIIIIKLWYKKNKLHSQLYYIWLFSGTFLLILLPYQQHIKFWLDWPTWSAPICHVNVS